MYILYIYPMFKSHSLVVSDCKWLQHFHRARFTAKKKDDREVANELQNFQVVI